MGEGIQKLLTIFSCFLLICPKIEAKIQFDQIFSHFERGNFPFFPLWICHWFVNTRLWSLLTREFLFMWSNCDSDIKVVAGRSPFSLGIIKWRIISRSTSIILLGWFSWFRFDWLLPSFILPPLLQRLVILKRFFLLFRLMSCYWESCRIRIKCE